MIGALSVTDGTSDIALSTHPLLTSLADVSVWPLLIIITVVLALVSQRSLSSIFFTNTNKSFTQNSSLLLKLVLSMVSYLFTGLLAIVLIVGSVLQALNSHQQAQTTKISDSMRVQALITIEGVSDSVYDPTTNSGYRQVATISHISPLVAELTAYDLSAKALDQIKQNNNRPDSPNNLSQNLQHRILLNAYPKSNANDIKLASINSLQPGDQVMMALTLAPLTTSQEAINNPTGFDSYHWLRSRHIDGVANIMAVGKPIGNVIKPSAQLLTTTHSTSYFNRLRTRIDQGRWQLRQHFYQDWASQTTAQQQANAVTLSLLTGDRSLINRATKDLYQLAGISHLLAISGTHVLFLAIILAGAAVLIFNRLWPTLYRYIPRWQVRWLVMISAAFIYALFTGFDVPAARTAWMLLAIGAVRLTLLPISTMRVLLALAVLMAWIDPYVLWQAGYWLSFIAVALLLKYDDALQNQHNHGLTSQRQHKISQKRGIFHTKIWPLLKRVFKLQSWLFIALLPITLLLFGKASLWSLVINLFAIGLFGWIIVPLNLLAGLCYLLIPSVADSVWALVSMIVLSLHELVTWLTALPKLQGAWLYTPVNSAILLMALLVLLPWLLPRGLLSRWLALPPLTLLAMTIYANQQALVLTPTLYVLPTGDRYLSAAVLQYPIHDHQTDNKKRVINNSVSWLFLADHRPDDIPTKPSSLAADKLSVTLEQQLRTLSIKRLEGIVVQTGVIGLTNTLSSTQKTSEVSKSINNEKIPAELLPMTVAQLAQNFPINQYWQAGRYERWAALAKSYLATNSSNSNTSDTKVPITPQGCEQGKTWQLADSNLTLQAITGWSKIDDASVWDCALAINSDLPIRVVQYNAADPLQSPLLSIQKTIQQATTDSISSPEKTQQVKQPFSSQSRIVLDAAKHQRIWQMWSLLCEDKSVSSNSNYDNSITWLSHSASKVTSEALMSQNVDEVMTYDSQSLAVGFVLADKP